MQIKFPHIFNFRSIIDLLLTVMVFISGYILVTDSKSVSTYFWLAATVIVLTFVLDMFRAYRSPGPDKKYAPILPVLYLFGVFGALSVLSADVLIISLVVVLGIVFYLYQLYTRKTVPGNYKDFFVLLTGLLDFVTIYALGFFFNWPWWILLVLIFSVTFLLLWQVFYRIKDTEELVRIVFLLSLISLEVGWSTFFLPFHFLSSAVIVFMTFYLIYILSDLYFRHSLTSKKLYFHLFLSFIVLLGVFLSSPWSY